MINSITSNLQASIAAFVAANYSAIADVSTLSIYVFPEFDPEELDSYKKFISPINYGVVIHNIELDNDPEAPWGFLKMRYSADVTFFRKTGADYAVASKHNIVTQGQTGTPLVTSIHAVTTNFAKYLRANKITDCFWNDASKVNPYKSTGDYRFVTSKILALRMESTTITV